MNGEMNFGNKSLENNEVVSNDLSNQSTYGENGSFNKANKKKKFPIIFMGALVVFLVVTASSFYYFKMLSSQNVFTIFIDGVFDYMDSSLMDSSNKKENLVGSLSFKINDIKSNDTDMKDLFETFRKIDFNADYGIDFNKKLISLNFKSNFDGKKFINASVFTKSGTGYIYLEDVYDKYISTSIEDYDSLFEQSLEYEVYKKLLDSFRSAIKGALKEEYFSEEDVTVNGKKLHKTSLIMNNNNFNAIKNDIINSLLSDEDFLKEYASIIDYDVEELKEELEYSLDEEMDFGNGTISIYTNSLKLAMFEIVTDSGTFSVTIDGDNYKFELVEDNEKIVDASINVTKVGEQVTVDFKFTEHESDGLIDFTIITSTDDNGRVIEVDTSNSIDYEDISEKDLSKISSKLFKNDVFSELFSQIYSIDFSNSFSSNTWYDEDSI